MKGRRWARVPNPGNTSAYGDPGKEIFKSLHNIVPSDLRVGALYELFITWPWRRLTPWITHIYHGHLLLLIVLPSLLPLLLHFIKKNSGKETVLGVKETEGRGVTAASQIYYIIFFLWYPWLNFSSPYLSFINLIFDTINIISRVITLRSLFLS